MGVSKLRQGAIAPKSRHFSLNVTDLQSHDFVINRFFRKLFTTKNIEIVKYCQEYFGFALPSVLWAKRLSKFDLSFKCFLSAL